MVVILPDETVAWEGQEESLYRTMATGNCALANRLDKLELAAVNSAAQHGPYALDPDGYYRQILAKLREMNPDMSRMTLGRIRRHIVVSIGSGCQTPLDVYLGAAVRVKG